MNLKKEIRCGDWQPDLNVIGEPDYDSLDAKFDCSFRNWNPKED